MKVFGKVDTEGAFDKLPITDFCFKSYVCTPDSGFRTSLQMSFTKIVIAELIRLFCLLAFSGKLGFQTPQLI